MNQHSPPGSITARESIALYIHWPFCVSKCPYCDFNSHVRAEVDQAAWLAALIADLAHEASATAGRTLGSIFFGGGTPSLMPPATVAALINAATRHWRTDSDLEITLEANPSSVEAARFADLSVAGVNRVSLGLQALDDATLAFLGRAHSVSEGLSALAVAQARFARVSVDLIYARPDQSLAAWDAELDRAIALGTGHISLYQLTIEPGTRFATLVRQGKLHPLDNDRAADQFERTRARLAGVGMPAYEVSNHARPGEESRHNLTYWRYGDYLGIGPGAHGRRGGFATLRHKKPENWLSSVTRHGHGMQALDVLSPLDASREALLMGLRLREGVDLDDIARRSAVATPVDLAVVFRLEQLGLLETCPPRLYVTEAGIGVLDAILTEIVT